MKVTVVSTNPVQTPADLLAVFATKDKNFDLTLEAQAIDKALSGLISDIAKEESFEGAMGKTLHVYPQGKVSAKRVFVVGTGSVHDLSFYDLESLFAVIGRKAKDAGAKTVVVAIPNVLTKQFGAEKVGEAAVMGVTLGTYTFLKHKQADVQKKDKTIDALTLLTPSSPRSSVSSSLEQGASRGAVVARAIVMTRDLVNEPPSITTPTYLAGVAEGIAKSNKGITCEVLSKPEMKKLGMGGLLGIAQGSDEEPKFVKLEYKGGSGKTVALVGKGITFDTGGLSLKPSEGMETMKLDMAGAAAIIGVFSVLSELKPKVNVVGLLSITENMPSGKAIKPSDVVRAMNGKTIEVLNTDAEGRVVLADGLSYAVEKVKPDVMIDVATLTGACMVALGEEIAGIFSNNRQLAEALKSVASASGEKIWELPLAKEYKELLKSTVADIKNISGKRYGGATNGALFLQEFVPDIIPWAHLDIAGPAFAEKDSPLTPRGGTGFGVALLLEYLKNQ